MIQRRILFIFNAFEKDAPSSTTFALARGAHQAGYQVHCAAWSRGGPLEVEINAAGIQTVVLGSSSFKSILNSIQNIPAPEKTEHGQVPWQPVPRQLGMFQTARRLAKLINQLKPQIVHSILVRPNLGVTLSHFTGTRHTFSWVAADHGIHEWYEKGQIVGHLNRLILPGVLSRSDAVVSVSESARSDLLQTGIPPHRTHVIPNGINPRRFYPRPKSERFSFLASNFATNDPSSKIFLIGSAGNLRFLKGYDLLIKAAELVVTTEPRSRFVIWGTGPELPRLQDLVNTLNLATFVTFSGYDPAIEYRLPLLDLYIQSSRSESFGLAAAEAMACAVPVIVSDVGGLRSLVDHEQSGLKFPPEDFVALANQILLLIQRNQFRKKLAQGGRLRVLHSYTEQRMINAGLSLYNGLLEAKGL